MLRFLLIFVLCAFAPNRVWADDSDDTLRYYMSNSGLVVAGEIISEPQGLYDEAGVINYITELGNIEVLYGAAGAKPLYIDKRLDGSKSEGKEIQVGVVRFESTNEDSLPYFKKGSKVILFLSPIIGGDGTLVTADFWFGVQPYSPWVARSIKRLAEEKDDK